MASYFIKKANKIGLFFVILYLLCFLWFWIHPVEQELHVQLLKLSFYGFSGMNPLSFFSGLLQSYIWGYIALFLWSAVEMVCKTKK